MYKKALKDTCRLCLKFGAVERHHLIYKPERTVNLCHNCHFKVHYRPELLTESEIKTLYLARYKGKELQEKLKNINNINKTCYALRLALSRDPRAQVKFEQAYFLIAPSRRREM